MGTAKELVLFRLDMTGRRSLSGHSLQLRAQAGRTGFPFERKHWYRRQTARERA
jgi:hypothetical protein